MCLNKDIDYSWINRIEQDFLMINIHKLSATLEAKKLKEGDLSSAINAIVDVIQSADLIENRSQSIGSFFLPAPNQITEKISHTYNDNSLSVENVLTKGIVGAFTSGTRLEGTIGFVEQQLSRNTMFLDPKIVNTYEKTSPREYGLMFVLMPKDKVEAQAYVDIITCLKDISKAQEKKMLGFLPYLQQDHVVSFEFAGTLHENNFINKLILCDASNTNGFFISGIESNIQSSGFNLMFNDGMPKMITLTISLVERKPLYYNFWNGKENI